MLPFNWSAAERPQPLDFFTLVNSKTLAACFPLFQTSTSTRGAIAHEKKKKLYRFRFVSNTEQRADSISGSTSLKSEETFHRQVIITSYNYPKIESATLGRSSIMDMKVPGYRPEGIL